MAKVTGCYPTVVNAMSNVLNDDGKNLMFEAANVGNEGMIRSVFLSSVYRAF
jgi:hypothetical protein